jgi:hypothetical protein
VQSGRNPHALPIGIDKRPSRRISSVVPTSWDHGRKADFPFPMSLREFPADLNAAGVQSLVKPSEVHCSEPTPLWTKKRPSGSYFFLISTRRGWLVPQ